MRAFVKCSRCGDKFEIDLLDLNVDVNKLLCPACQTHDISECSDDDGPVTIEELDASEVVLDVTKKF